MRQLTSLYHFNVINYPFVLSGRFGCKIPRKYYYKVEEDIMDKSRRHGNPFTSTTV